MKKTWKLLEATDQTLLYKWNGSTGKGKKFTVYRDEFNNWNAAQLEGEEKREIPESVRILHIIDVAKFLGLS